MISENSTLDDVAFAVCTALERHGIEAILTGGSAAAHYAAEAIQSLDADFVLRFGAQGGESEALATIGFSRKPNHYYANPRTIYTVEFPVGPLMVGSELIRNWETEYCGDERLHVLTPYDSVRDRFMAFYAWVTSRP